MGGESDDYATGMLVPQIGYVASFSWISAVMLVTTILQICFCAKVLRPSPPPQLQLSVEAVPIITETAPPNSVNSDADNRWKTEHLLR